ncbi:MAG: hypothetical protein AABW56_04035 [Nanoarchaeota archaeon]
MKKSQVSTEFMFFVGMGFVLLAAYLVISYNYLNLTFERRDIITSLDTLEQIRNEINLAGRVENGYTRIVNIPPNINRQGYSLGIRNREIVVRFKNVDYARLLSTHVNLDTYTNGSLYFAPGNKIFITKVNDEVYIDKICNMGDQNICSSVHPGCQSSYCILTCKDNVWVYSSECGFGEYCNPYIRRCELPS